MTSKRKNFLKWIPSVAITIFMTSGAIMEFTNAPAFAAQYARIGLQDHMAVFAITELLITALFLWRRTMKLGLLLFTGYFGGAMGVELSLGNLFIFPAIILAIVWIAAYLRDASLFKFIFKQQKSFA